ncbi:alpha-amylase (fragment) [Xanthomonas fragariae]|uniref:Alpha-amylase n=2 Tax=Xanthomonas fragariae TaxID=48664 RepID=A0A1Y6GZU7_9XANT|nr:hypothetical protein [Xanthomonas fragariae]ENZ94360.1 alpha-amylase [Xanthomonas fragariae LMG 25863]AOD14124.1 hypothetical protein BER92_04520 [Xanthomonas fragariae]AOD17510.1 hypothetical protein BER93_04525 [Xanthomonas fragariae]SMQ96396.1 putative alpha-amylase [Xanthomonas fragariae]SMR00301.1 hypothetical protein PD885_03079 [Xanthomonas fragariae]
MRFSAVNTYAHHRCCGAIRAWHHRALHAMRALYGTKHITFDHLNRIFDAGIRSGVYAFGQVITGGDTDSGDDDQFLAP